MNAELIAEFDNDPNGLGYKSAPVEADGYKSTKALTGLLGAMQFTANATAPQIQKPMDADALFNALADAEIAAIGIDGFGQIQEAIASGDRPRVKRLLKIAKIKGWLTEQREAVFVAAVDATIADPDWPAQVATKPRLVELAEANGWTDSAGRPLTSIAAETIDAALGRV